MNALREEILRRLSLSWPHTLIQWESRERRVTDASGVYAPRPSIPRTYPNHRTMSAESTEHPAKKQKAQEKVG